MNVKKLTNRRLLQLPKEKAASRNGLGHLTENLPLTQYNDLLKKQTECQD